MCRSDDHHLRCCSDTQPVAVAVIVNIILFFLAIIIITIMVTVVMVTTMTVLVVLMIIVIIIFIVMISSVYFSPENFLGGTAPRRLEPEVLYYTDLFCLTSQQHASVSQGRICSDNFTCCHTEIEAADQTFHLTRHSILTPGQPVPALTQ